MLMNFVNSLYPAIRPDRMLQNIKHEPTTLKQRRIDVETTLFRCDLFQWFSLSTFGNSGISRLIRYHNSCRCATFLSAVDTCISYFGPSGILHLVLLRVAIRHLSKDKYRRIICWRRLEYLVLTESRIPLIKVGVEHEAKYKKKIPVLRVT